jgi:uncharacterized protein YydD (DUF2326 family)
MSKKLEIEELKKRIAELETLHKEDEKIIGEQYLKLEIAKTTLNHIKQLSTL